MNVLFFYLLNVSIPQAVSAVATILNANKGGDVTFVSIPQAVSAVATILILYNIITLINDVSIPQAVSAVATRVEVAGQSYVGQFQYRKR